MSESHKPGEAEGLPLQGPHWHRVPDPGVVPLRLVLQPSGLTVELNQPALLVGRHSEADVRLPLPDVSRRHCRFVFADGRWQVHDLSSLNGTFVNDQPVQQAALHHHDVVRIGGFTFEVDFPEAAPDDGEPPVTGEVLRGIADALPRTVAETMRNRQAS
jgi:pSer/pThr/pTyr-binding forkhead associated (FHA) protein